MAAVGCLRRVLAGSHDLLALARAWPTRYPGLLQSVAHGTAHARHDLLLGFPQDCIRLDADGQVRSGEGVVLGTDFLEVLDRAHAGVRTAEAVSDASADLQRQMMQMYGFDRSRMRALQDAIKMPMQTTATRQKMMGRTRRPIMRGRRYLPKKKTMGPVASPAYSAMRPMTRAVALWEK